MATETGEQLELLDVGPEHSAKIAALAAPYKKLIKQRLALQEKEAKAHAKLLEAVKAEKLGRLQDGSIRCRCDGWKIEVPAVKEKVKVTEIE